MDLTSDHPFWFVNNGLIQTYPPLEQDVECDVAIIGAGITGALIAARLAGDGYSVVVVDRRDVGLGSTSASTALLQYEIDVPLVELIRKIGLPAARRAYTLSYGAIDNLETIASGLKVDCEFRRKTSVYLAQNDSKAKLLAEETKARRECGIDVRICEPAELRDEFGLTGTAAIVSNQAASCDPYRMTHALIESAVSNGARIFDRTEVRGYEQNGIGVLLKTSRQASILAKTVVIATGYEVQTMLREKIVDLKNTYALISQPLKSVSPWNQDWLMWQAADPYLYLRITTDNRLLVGGEDDPFSNPRLRDASLAKKAQTIRGKVIKLLPEIEWEIEFAWAGTFGETKDGLPYIGENPAFPNFLFALGFGGNGITFSVIAADLLSGYLAGKPSQDLELFRFDR